jgi:hypothetical protein
MDRPLYLSARIATAHLGDAPEQGLEVLTLGTVFVGTRYAEVWRLASGVAWYVTFGFSHTSRDSTYVGDKAQAIQFAVNYLSALPC